MKWMRTGLMVGMVLGFLVLDANGKHICPKIRPVEVGGIRFVVPNDQGFRGYVQAWDVTTGKQLWEKTIYRVVWRFPFPELDVYYCVVIQMKAKDGILLIQNDRKKWYSVCTSTRKVKRVSSADAGEEPKENSGQHASAP